METEHLKRVIEDQRSEEEKKFREEKILEREATGHVEKFLKHPNILAILGVRRSGKSTFSLLLSRKLGGKTAYINFDDERLMGLRTEDLDRVLLAFYELYGDPDLVVLDEIQNIRGWELFASRLRRTKKVIVTGSNSELLGGELATRLTGRHIDFTLYPFSFREALSFKPNIYLTEHIAKVRKELERYVSGSGFPEFGKFGPRIVAGIYGDIINKDCIRRHRIREEETFREISRYLISNFSGEFTYSKLSNIFGVKDVHTAKNYVSYLEEAFLAIALERFSPKLKQRMIAPKKAYAIDQGFCNFIGFRSSRDIGRLYENVVCVELMRRKAAGHGMDVCYWKDHQQNEVDFVVREGAKVGQLIQVCYSMEEHNAKERETKALARASEETGCRNLLVITDDHEGRERKGGREIRFVPLWKWLIG